MFGIFASQFVRLQITVGSIKKKVSPAGAAWNITATQLVGATKLER